LKYRLIDEGSYDLQEPADRRNLVAVLFWLEKTPEPTDLQRGIQRLVELLDGPDDGELRSAFASWLQLVKLPSLGVSEEDIPEVLGLEEFKAMLEERVKEWNKVLLQRGAQQGEATMLLRQLEVKFGKVDARTRMQVEAAAPERLLQWAERLVTAERLADVFS